MSRVNRLRTGCFEQFQQALGQRAILLSGGWPSEVRTAGDTGWSEREGPGGAWGYGLWTGCLLALRGTVPRCQQGPRISKHLIQKLENVAMTSCLCKTL